MQPALTIAILHDGLDQTLSRQAIQTPAGSAVEAERIEDLGFKEVFDKLSRKMMTTMGGGLTEEEKKSLG